MKKFRPNIAAMVAIAALAATAVSCSNNDVVGNDGDGNPGGGGSTASNIQASSLADFSIYSTRSAVLSSTRSGETETSHFEYFKVVDMEGYTNEKQLKEELAKKDATYCSTWENRPKKADRGEFVSTDEYNYVIKYLQEHPDEGWTNIDIDMYYIQYVGGGNHQYTTTKDRNGYTQTVWNASGHMNEIKFGENAANDYNANYGPRAFVKGCNLKDNTPSYKDSWGNVNVRKYNHYKYYYITYNGQKNLYLGFDYVTEKDGKEKYEGDGIYDDYVIKIVAASEDKSNTDGKVDPAPTPDPTPTPTPDVKPVPGAPEVQIDLNVKDDQHLGTDSAYARNETKLSIHVRDTVDVEVYIPIAKEYYCNKDDMFIVERHKEGYWVYNGDNAEGVNQEVVSMNIAGDDITLTVSYEPEGIRIKTKGIGANALKYCRQEFGDGITFEVSNYFTGFANASALLEALKDAKPTVKFYKTDGSLISGYEHYDENALIDDAKDIVVEQAK